MAAAFLVRRGAVVTARNLRVGRGELDLVVRHGGELVAVEVKTIGWEATADEPIDRIDDAKLRQVRRVVNESGRGVRRIDFVGVRLHRNGVIVNWRTHVA